jgi:hypothetical protein
VAWHLRVGYCGLWTVAQATVVHSGGFLWGWDVLEGVEGGVGGVGANILDAVDNKQKGGTVEAKGGDGAEMKVEGSKPREMISSIFRGRSIEFLDVGLWDLGHEF